MVEGRERAVSKTGVVGEMVLMDGGDIASELIRDGTGVHGLLSPEFLFERG